ncbi:MAG: ROK family transcriptional regulator [Anaerolineae bacterium]|nr:ROK family transcriptional regulator [Anaerolineae bacterium]
MAKRQLLKTINRVAILNAIKAHGAIARTDIAIYTHLSPATVTSLTAELIRDGLIYEKQAGISRGGRRPILLALNAEGAVVVGIKLAENDATLALTDLNAHIIKQHTIRLDERDPESTSQQLARGVDGLLAKAGARRSRLLGVGVGLAGMIDSQAGICRVSPHNGWREVPFSQLLEDQLDCIVYLDNNVNALTLVEQLYGAGQHVPNFLVITVGHGIGLGIVANGQVVRGANGGAGEFGHTVVDPSGFECTCGNHGCLETFVADAWLVRRAQIRGLDVDSALALTVQAQNGDARAVEVFAQAGEVLGCGMANLVNLFNPALIVISGEGVRAGDLLFGPMKAAMQRHMFAQLAEDLEVCIEPLTDETWARGAAGLVLERIFSLPALD